MLWSWFSKVIQKPNVDEKENWQTLSSCVAELGRGSEGTQSFEGLNLKGTLYIKKQTNKTQTNQTKPPNNKQKHTPKKQANKPTKPTKITGLIKKKYKFK